VEQNELSMEAAHAAALQRFLLTQGQVRNLRVMEDGHAGLIFGLELVGNDSDARSFILKKAPAGVPRGGSTDVFRQAALLQALSRRGFPAPNVFWAHDDDDVLGAPFIIMQRLPGRTVIVWDPAPDTIARSQCALARFR
jgi:aminoglycoside phosphotransferase (APT) family kinase protein